MNDYLRYIQSFPLSCNLICQMTRNWRLESQSVVRVALLNCLFRGRLQNSSEKDFGMRVVILCLENWDNVTQRNSCEWKKEVCMSNTG